MPDFIQFELWKDCNVHCPFCFNLHQKDNDKLEMISFVNDKLNSSEIHDEMDFGLIGGEFFDTQLKNISVKKEFYKLFMLIRKKIDEKKIGRLLITTSLLFDRKKELVDFLKYLEILGLIKYTVICTSYDTIYRFKNEKAKELWESNMLFLKETYPDLRLHTEIIVTKNFLENVLNGTFNILKFKETYQTAVDYIDPEADEEHYSKQQMIKDLPEFYPDENLFLSFLQFVYENNLVDFSTFLKMDIRSNKIYTHYNGKMILIDNRRENKCWGDDIYSFGFSDSNKKMRDVVDEFLETVE